MNVQGNQMNIFNSLFMFSLILSGGLGAIIGFALGRGVAFIADALGATIGDYSFQAAGACGVIGIVITARWWAKRSRNPN